jgi:hypothetical protein
MFGMHLKIFIYCCLIKLTFLYPKGCNDIYKKKKKKKKKDKIKRKKKRNIKKRGNNQGE